MGSSIEYLGYGPEGLLTSGVPNLELKDLFFHFYQVRAEFDAYCHIMVVFEVILHESLKDTRFSDARIPDDYYFE
jgi:hypothetical protein